MHPRSLLRICHQCPIQTDQHARRLSPAWNHYSAGHRDCHKSQFTQVLPRWSSPRFAQCFGSSGYVVVSATPWILLQMKVGIGVAQSGQPFYPCNYCSTVYCHLTFDLLAVLSLGLLQSTSSQLFPTTSVCTFTVTLSSNWPCETSVPLVDLLVSHHLPLAL